MLKNRNIYRLLNILIATVWLANGLFCKVFDFVPRHQEIVAGILGTEYARPLILTIGILETCMAIWILTGFKSKLNAILQIGVVAMMNVLEFIFVPDLLLWGKLNSLFAFLFILLVFYNEFVLKKKIELQKQ